MNAPSPVLKACPFCGSGAAIGEEEGVTLYRHAGGTAWQAICDRCSASTREGRTKEDAAAWWNDRATPMPGETDEHGDMPVALMLGGSPHNQDRADAAFILAAVAFARAALAVPINKIGEDAK